MSEEKRNGFDSQWLAPFRFAGTIDPVHEFGESRDAGGPTYLLGEPAVLLRPDITLTGNILTQGEFVIRIIKECSTMRIDIHRKEK